MSDLSRARIEERLTTARLGRSLELKSTTESTNDDARAAAGRGAPDGHVVVADAQTRGRGSRGREWLSPPGSDLYLSIVAHVDLPPAQLPPLTLAVGLATALTLEPLLGGPRRAAVKWPNDVWVAQRKLAGVLVESASMGERVAPLVLGIGINVNRTSFPAALSVPATSLALERGGALLDRSSVLAALLNELEPWLDRFVAQGAAPIIAAIAERLALKGERAECEGVVGVVEGIAPSGALLLRDERGLHAVSAGTLRACEPAGDAPA
jgi:BirA family biotin operon repressor/biotin-[acetyl-CoA-carboxylase] ligase